MTHMIRRYEVRVTWWDLDRTHEYETTYVVVVDMDDPLADMSGVALDNAVDRVGEDAEAMGRSVDWDTVSPEIVSRGPVVPCPREGEEPTMGVLLANNADFVTRLQYWGDGALRRELRGLDPTTARFRLVARELASREASR